MEKIQVILKEDVPNLGRSGDLVAVKPGYGRNYLIPQGLALPATRKNVAQMDHERKQIEASALKLRKDAESVISAAEVQAERIIQNAHTRLVRIVEDINELKRQKAQFEGTLRSLIQTHQKLLEAMMEGDLGKSDGLELALNTKANGRDSSKKSEPEGAQVTSLAQTASAKR